MDAAAAPVDDDEGAELDALRRRAYGPGEGIEHDADALARLNQLEDASRARGPAGGAAEASTPATGPTAAIIAAAAEAETSTPAADPTPTPWWRLRPVLWSAAALAMIGVVVTTIALVANPPPDALLGRSPVQVGQGAQAFDRGLLEYYGLELSDLVAREEYHGLNAWSAVNDRGQRCLFVGWGSIMWNGACVPDGLDPIIDLTVDPSMPVDLEELPSGSLVRFTLVGDDLEVRVALADVGA